jgi:hypothetical protein
MKKLVAIFSVITFALSSCSFVKFDRPPGDPIKEFPNNMQGDYRPKDSWLMKSDSAIISFYGTQIIIENGEYNATFQIDQDMLATKFEKYYVLAFQDVEIKSLFNLLIIEPKNNQLLIYPIIKERTNMNSQAVIEKYFGAKVVGLESVNTEPPQPRIDANGGISIVSALPSSEPNTIKYYSMDDSQFANFLKDELKNLKPYILNTYKKPVKKK